MRKTGPPTPLIPPGHGRTHHRIPFPQEDIRAEQLPSTCLFSRKGSLPTEFNFFLRSGRLLGYVPKLKGPRVLRVLPAPQRSMVDSRQSVENSDSGCSKRPQMRGAREIDERRRICRYVEARRSSATKQVSFFQQPAKAQQAMREKGTDHENYVFE